MGVWVGVCVWGMSDGNGIESFTSGHNEGGVGVIGCGEYAIGECVAGVCERGGGESGQYISGE